MTPGHFVEAIRVDMARCMLQDTNQPLQRIATACGFSTTEALRRAFVRQLGVTPRQYRARFQSSYRPAAAARRNEAVVLQPG